MPGDGPAVEMNFQGAVPLDALLGYLSGKLGVQYQFDAAIARREITLRTPRRVPAASLPVLLGNVLRAEGLMLVDTDDPAVKRIVAAGQMMSLATIKRRPEPEVLPPPRPSWGTGAGSEPTGPPPRRLSPPAVDSAEDFVGLVERPNPATPVTEVFSLRHVEAAGVIDVLRPFASGSAASIQAVPGANALIVTDYASSIESLRRVIELIDQPNPTASLTHYRCRHQNAAVLVEQAKRMLRVGENGGGGESLVLLAQPLENRIAIAGSATQITDAHRLLDQLDVVTEVITEVYRVRHLAAERLATLLEAFAPAADRDTPLYRVTVDEVGNQLIVRGGPAVHRQVVDLIARMDVASPGEESPIRFYKLKNAVAAEVLQSLLALAEVSAQGGGAGPFGGLPGFGGLSGFGGYPAGLMTAAPVAVAAPAALPITPLPPAVAGGAAEPPAGGAMSRRGAADAPTTAGAPMRGSVVDAGGALGLAGGGGGVARLPGGARVSADVATNSLIVYAPASVQSMYERLIRSLDQRRPQVLIQAQVIAVSTTDNYSLGIEVSGGDRGGGRRLFNFTSFGLNEVDPLTGALNLSPSLGFNGAVLDPGIADVIVQALARHDRSRVLASPKILVNDNATGTLESVVSVPFASVNASQTVSTTSLGGSQQAGTIITVTPRINENDHLQLDFDVEFSTFAGAGSETLPPQRQIDRVGSSVTIPSGKTVIVGGLRRVSDAHSESGLPLLEKVPVLRHLTGRTIDNHQTTSFFLFIRPVVLRDSRFADLRFLTGRELDAACLPGELPVSHPEAIVR